MNVTETFSPLIVMIQPFFLLLCYQASANGLKYMQRIKMVIL